MMFTEYFFYIFFRLYVFLFSRQHLRKDRTGNQ